MNQRLFIQKYRPTNQRNRLVFALVSFLMLGLATPMLLMTATQAKASVRWLDNVIAVVDDDVIMKTELAKRMNVIISRLNAQNTPLPSLDVLRKRILDQLILESIQLQMAARMGLRVDDSQLNETLQRIAKGNNYTLAEFRDALRSEGTSFREAREQIRHEMIIGRLQQNRVGRLVRITDDEIKAYLGSAEGRKRTAAEYYLGHILVAIPDSASPEQEAKGRQRAEAILTDLRNGVDFKQEAVAKSDAQNALQGGVIGWRKEQELPSIAVDQIPGLKKGEFTGVMKTGSGYHIMMVLDKRGGQEKVITQTHVRHILIKPSAIRTDKEAEHIANTLHERLERGDDFATLAKARSEDPISAISGGDLDWVSPHEMVPEFEDVMNNTKEGKISQPFKSKFGWHILKVLGRRQQDVGQKLQENQARQIINKRKFDDELVGWLRKTREEAFVEFKNQDWNAKEEDVK